MSFGNSRGRKISIWIFIVILEFQGSSSLSPLWESIKTAVYEGYDVKYENGSSFQAVKKLNKPEDSDIVVGEDIEESNQVILTCTAWYPTKWVYTGDGSPEYTTNTTSEYLGPHGQLLPRGNETNGAKRFKASLFLGYTRKLSGLDSGRYNCITSSPQSGAKYYKLSAFYYLYVPAGEQLFTRTVGDTVIYDLDKSPARIPCSVTNPKVAVSLQKYHDGILKCLPHNDEAFYHPISGFYPQHDIPGTYICTAAYKNSFQHLYFTLIPSDPSKANVSLVELLEEGKLTQPDEPICSDDSCGKEAECSIIESTENDDTKIKRADCKCPYGYFGDPFKQCHRSQLDWYGK